MPATTENVQIKLFTKGDQSDRDAVVVRRSRLSLGVSETVYRDSSRSRPDADAPISARDPTYRIG